MFVHTHKKYITYKCNLYVIIYKYHIYKYVYKHI